MPKPRRTSNPEAPSLPPGIRLLRTLKGHTNYVWSVAVTPDGQQAVTGSGDHTVRVWDLASGACLRTLEGHTGSVWSVAVTADGQQAVTGSDDHTVRVWDLASGACLRTLEGHTGGVLSVAVTPDGKRLVSGSDDGTARVWAVVWQLLWGAAPPTIRYQNAKIVLLGETGVGKTGLMKRLTEDRWVETGSTHGMNVSRIELPIAAESGLEREAWLWDLAGQPDYRLIHQLFLDETGVALVVVNPQADDPFEGVGDWLKALQAALSKAKHQPARVLIAGRTDVGGMKVSQEAIDRFLRENDFADYLPTSAQTGLNCSDNEAGGTSALKRLITEHIPWHTLTEVSTDKILRELKNAVIERANRTEASRLVRFAELDKDVRTALPEETIEEPELRTAVKLLGNQGLILPLEFGDLILLEPAILNDYAAAVIRQARENPDQIGSVPEQDVLDARIDLTGVDRLPKPDEQLLLRALVQTFLDRSLCLREPPEDGAQLVFPSQFRRDRPPRDFPETETIVTYTFSGELPTVFATLTVRLWYTRGFDNKDIYQNAAEFATPLGGRVGFFQERIAEGTGRISVYAEPAVTTEQCCVFVEYVHRHLHAHAMDVVRERRYRCPSAKCAKPVADAEAVRSRLKTRKTFITCAYCDRKVPLIDEIERRCETDAVARKVRELDELASVELSTQAMEQILVGHMLAICGEANQIYREVLQADVGIDGEIEFRDDKGRATGTRIYVQLKHGASYLRERLRDEAVVFDVKNPRHLDYWQQQPSDVYLVVKVGDDIQWMNVTRYLRTRADKTSKQIIFTGERLDAKALLRLRATLL